MCSQLPFLSSGPQYVIKARYGASFLLCSPPGPPGGRRRMGRISHGGGGPSAPPMGG